MFENQFCQSSPAAPENNSLGCNRQFGTRWCNKPLSTPPKIKMATAPSGASPDAYLLEHLGVYYEVPVHVRMI